MFFNSLVCFSHDAQNVEYVLSTRFKHNDFDRNGGVMQNNNTSLTRSFVDCSYKMEIAWQVIKSAKKFNSVELYHTQFEFLIVSR